MYLHVNIQQHSRDDYLLKLTQAGMMAHNIPYASQAIKLDKPCPVDNLPNFSQGAASVQDLSAQLACSYLKLAPGLAVLDACAGPGGKTSHILESEPDLKRMTALEKVPERAEKISCSLRRLQLNADVIVNDAGALKHWWDGEHYDRILLDAPCSATGIIRRHPDIKLRRTRQEVDTINELQTRLLASLWETLKPDGILLYVTCSILKIENSHTIKSFLKTHSDARLDVIDEVLA